MKGESLKFRLRDDQQRAQVLSDFFLLLGPIKMDWATFQQQPRKWRLAIRLMALHWAVGTVHAGKCGWTMGEQ